MRGRIPTKSMAYYMPLKSWPQKLVVNLFGKWMIKQYDFQECFFLENAKKFRKELKCPLTYVGGLVSREGIERVLAEGFETVQMARALVNDPDFVSVRPLPRDWLLRWIKKSFPFRRWMRWHTISGIARM